MNILITGFNRPDAFKLVLESVASQSYDNLFLSVDAASESDQLNYEKNSKLRQYVTAYAERRSNVHLILYKENQGCRKAVSQSITRCFNLVDDLIILEDDCVPMPGFFEYCEWALKKFRLDYEIGSISSQSFLFQKYQPAEDVFFSKYHHCWGWATWKRAWAYYRDDVSSFTEFMNSAGLTQLSSNEIGFENYWKRIYSGLCSDQFDSWAYRWLFSCWDNGMLSVIPRYSLVKNIGFDNEATHTKYEPNGIERNFHAGWVPSTFSSPKNLTRDLKAERVVSNCHYHCWTHSTWALSLLAMAFRKVRINFMRLLGVIK